ncbi:MAG: SDR family oxidoreductase [Chloroflexota bacterium]
MRLAGKVAIVTGASRGIGNAIALAFAHEGAKVAVVARDKARCDEAVAQIIKSGGDAISIQTDIASEKDVARMIEQTKEKYQRIDILVNNAAVYLGYKKVIDTTLDEWNWVIGTNLTGVFLCCKAVLPQMMAQKYGKIINLSSIGGRSGAPGRSHYRATKAAIINFTQCLAAEIKQFGIDVNAICPGGVATDMLRGKYGGELPKTVMPPEDIAAVAVFLASDESRAITATAIDAFGYGNPVFGIAAP